MSDEKDLREAKEFILVGAADMQRAQGQIPDVRNFEREIVNPVLSKIDQDAAPRVVALKKPEDREWSDGEWMDEPDHSPKIGAGKIAAPHRGETLVVSQKVLGEVTLGPDGLKVPDHLKALAEPPMPRVERQLRDMVRALWTLPDWKARLQAVTMSDLLPHERAKKYEQILGDAIRLFGDLKPIAARDPKIIVSGQ